MREETQVNKRKVYHITERELKEALSIPASEEILIIQGHGNDMQIYMMGEDNA